MKVLLEAGEDPDTPYKSQTPTEAAIEGGHVSILSLLFKYGAKQNPKELVEACEKGNDKRVKVLLESGQNPDTPYGGQTPK